MSAPATAYVAGLEVTEEMIVAGRKAADDQYYKWRGIGPRKEGQGLDGMHFIIREALTAALSAHPDVPGVRVVTVAQLERWAAQYCADYVGYTQAKEEIRDIIGEIK